MSSGFDPLRRFEVENRLQTLDAEFYVRRARRSEVLGQSQQRQIPSILGRCHRARKRKVNFSGVEEDKLN